MTYSLNTRPTLPNHIMKLTLEELIAEYGCQNIFLPPVLDPRQPVRSTRDIASMFTDLKELEHEEFWVVTFNSAHEVLGKYRLTSGTATETPVHPRESFRKAIADNAVAVAFCHNHPGGSTDPSAQDLSVTRRLLEAGELLGIQVLDHVIMARKGWCSAMPI